MGICKSYNRTIKNDPLSESTTINNVQIGAPCVPLEKLNIASKVVCKINFYNKVTNTLDSATGFFMDIYPSFKCLLTNYHAINQNMVDDNLIIEVTNYLGAKGKLVLNKKERYIKCFDEPYDITVIQIKKTDKINKLFESLKPDLNYQNGYKTYKNIDIFIMEFPYGKNLNIAPGKITDIDEEKNFLLSHKILTNEGSSGSPIILISNLKVIGIHKGGYQFGEENHGTFIGVIFNEINEDIKLGLVKNIKIVSDQSNNNEDKSNYIIAEIDIDSKNINKDILIINSYEESKRRKNNFNYEEHLKNEKEIKNSQIYINKKEINFSYTHNFKKLGRYTISYKFKNKLTNTNHMFSDCSLLASINITKLDTENITNMTFMFADCISLINADLSYCDLQNVTDMRGIFYGCSSLKSVDFEKVETQKIINLSWAFASCKSLTEINLSDFHTENLEDTSSMFSDCESLININLKYFNTENVKNMAFMFKNCSSIKKLDLSYFETPKLSAMGGMFNGCRVLSSLDMTNFVAKNIRGGLIFDGCYSLIKSKVICQDETILSQLPDKKIDYFV